MRRLRHGLLPASLLLVSLLAAAPSTADDGQSAFVEGKCNKCHSVSKVDIEATIKSEKMRGPDLSKAGETHDTDWIKKYVLKKIQVDGKDHRAKWEGSDEDLQAIADWLVCLAESPPKDR